MLPTSLASMARSPGGNNHFLARPASDRRTAHHRHPASQSPKILVPPADAKVPPESSRYLYPHVPLLLHTRGNHQRHILLLSRHLHSDAPPGYPPTGPAYPRPSPSPRYTLGIQPPAHLLPSPHLDRPRDRTPTRTGPYPSTEHLSSAPTRRMVPSLRPPPPLQY